MDDINFCDTPLSLYSYGAIPPKQDIPYAGAGLDTNKNSNISNQKATLNDNEIKKTVNSNQLCTAVRPRSSSSSSTKTPVLVASKKASLKTVAFGLTTNIDETVEKSRPIPITKKLSAFRSNSNNLLNSSSKLENIPKDDESIKLSKSEFELLKKENAELKKVINEINNNSSNLRQIVVNLSTRILDLENHKNEFIKSISELRLCLNKNNLSNCEKEIDLININKKTNDSPNKEKNNNNKSCFLNEQDEEFFTQNFEKTQLNDTSLQMQSDKFSDNDLSLSQMSYQKSYDKPCCHKLQTAKENNLLKESVINRIQSARHLNSNEGNLKNYNEDEVKNLIAIIEDSIKNNSKMLRKAKEIFCNTNVLKQKNESNIHKQFNMMPSINYDKVPKIAQRMTVQRSELITYESPRQEKNVIRNKSERPFSNGDDVFFKSTLNYRDNCENEYFDENSYTSNDSYSQIEQQNLSQQYNKKKQTIIQSRMNQTESQIERRQRYRRK